MQVELCVRSILNPSHPLDSSSTGDMGSRSRDDVVTNEERSTEARNEDSEASKAALKSLTNYVSHFKSMYSSEQD